MALPVGRRCCAGCGEAVDAWPSSRVALMAGMGPAPKPAGTRQRRNATVPMTMLPASGRTGKTPPWPLPDDVAKGVMQRLAEGKVEQLQEELRDCAARSRAKLERSLDQALAHASVLEAEIAAQRQLESALWRDLWSTPQAAQWEELGWDRDVAQYVRHKVRAELGSLDDAKEARQWSDRLGLNPLAMLRLRWETERVDAAEAEGRRRRASSKPAAKKTAKRKDPRAALTVVSDTG